MKKEIIINSTINEVRVAITEDGQLAEFFIEFPEKERYIGNVYLGKVNKIVSGINAAFINIGLNQDAFLHFSDVDESLENSIITDEEDELDDDESAEYDLKKIESEAERIVGKHSDDKEISDADIALRKVKPATTDNGKKLPTFSTKKSGEIQITLEPKQNVIVQVVREAYANKGVKVTTKIAIPGRYLVLLPFETLLGVSRKIYSYPERKRLRMLARRFKPKEYGCIIRTVARGKSEEELKKDWQSLMAIWKEIESKVKKSTPPTMLYQDMNLAPSVVRDLFTTQVQSVIIDSRKLYKEITSYLKTSSPNLLQKVELYNGDKPIFEEYGVEKELAKTYKRRVPLSSGGDIVIEHTEAMVVIDVNSGRSTEKEQEMNAYKTNLEAAREVAKQIRLRDIAGMVIVDFIDMQHESNRKKLYSEMKKELSRDRAKTVIFPLTQIGLMQLTRQRINQNIVEKISEICPTCSGTGRITTKAVLLNNIERWLKKFRKESREFRLILQVHPQVADYITEGTFSHIAKLMLKYFVKINVQQNDGVGIDQFRFISERRNKDITNEHI